MIRRKNGLKVAGPADGVEIYSGTGTSYIDSGLTSGTTYHYRAFAMNDQDEPQTAECSVSGVPIKIYSWNKYNISYITSAYWVSSHKEESTSGDNYIHIGTSISDQGDVIDDKYSGYTKNIWSEFNGSVSSFIGCYASSEGFDCDIGKITSVEKLLYGVDTRVRVTAGTAVVNKTETQGTYITTVTSTNRYAYPDNGVFESYWYVFKG